MSDFEEKMEQLRARFRQRAATERALLAAALQGMERAEIRRLAHGLSGSAGVFGYPEVSVDAQALEEAVEGEAGPEALRVSGGKLLESLARVAQPV